MRITILRHGIPDLSDWGKITTSEMPEWIAAYNSAGVEQKISQSCQEMVNEFEHKFIVCSHLKRSIHSAKIIGYPLPDLVDSIFCEAELPVIQLPIIKLTPHDWSMVFRVFWFVGISKKVESLTSFKYRVSLAAEKLVHLATIHNSVLFIGHGIINRFLAKELILKGWTGKEAPNDNKYWGYKYWEYATYIKH
jgi:broad specificity phosphatase PhoE